MPHLREVLTELVDADPWIFEFLDAVFRYSLNFERVPVKLLSNVLKTKEERIVKVSRELHGLGLVEYFGQPFPSVRLQTLGADVLALHKLAMRGLVKGLGRQIGVGKESDVYEAVAPDNTLYSLKIFRLGRISFRQVRRLRSYGITRMWRPWLYRNVSAAKKEYNILKKLAILDLPVPRPVYSVMHVVMMEYLDGVLLKDAVIPPGDAEEVYIEIIDSIARIYEAGYVNGDLSEYNIFVLNEGGIKIIDWPQAVEKTDPSANILLKRDVVTVTKYFIRRYGLDKVFAKNVLAEKGFAEFSAEL